MLQMRSTGGGGTAQPTPTPAATLSPTPAPTLTALTPGKLTFDQAQYRLGAQLNYTAQLNQMPAPGAVVRIQVLEGSTIVASGVITDALGSEVAGTLTIPGMSPGNYVVRIMAGSDNLSQGTLTLIK
jgi:hypothetical protein